MPRHDPAKKDAANSEMRRWAVSTQGPVDVRMGEPTRSEVRVSYDEYIVIWGDTRGTETSQYPEEEKIRMISWVAASEREGAQTE